MKVGFAGIFALSPLALTNFTTWIDVAARMLRQQADLRTDIEIYS